VGADASGVPVVDASGAVVADAGDASGALGVGVLGVDVLVGLVIGSPRVPVCLLTTRHPGPRTRALRHRSVTAP
jgi:hypothetical protein